MASARGTFVLLAAAAACLLVAGTAAYGQYAVLDEHAFADRAASALRADEVRAEVAARMADRVADQRPGMNASAALVEETVASVLARDLRFHAAFRNAAARLHRALLRGPDGEAALKVDGSGAALRGALVARYPVLEGRVPRLEDVPLLTVGGDPRERALRRLAPLAATLAVPAVAGFALLALVLLAAAARRPERNVVWGAGLAVAAAAGLAAAAATAAEDVVLAHFDTGYGDAVVSELWSAYVGDLRVWALAACAVGLVAAAAAGGPRPSPRLVIATPRSRRARLARGAGLLVLAVLAVQAPELVLHTGFVALAAVLFYVAAGDLLRVVAPPRRARRPLRAAAGALVLIALVAAAAVPASGTEHLPDDTHALAP